MKMKTEPILYTKESLQQEQRRLKRVIRQQEQDLRQRVQKLPGELVYAGVDAVLPPVLTGSITNGILHAGKNFINKSIVQCAWFSVFGMTTISSLCDKILF